MIPQPFVKGGGERVFFGRYEYRADLVFDFGNPTCTSAFNSSRIVYNVGSAAITGSLIPYNNPGPIYPVLSSNNGGIAIFSAFAFGENYVQWDWKSTEQQSNVFIYKPNGGQSTGASQTFPEAAGANSIQPEIYYAPGSSRLQIDIADSSNSISYNIFGAKEFNTGSLNGQNGWNIFGVTADASSNHNLYINTNTSSFDNTTITRVTSGTQTTKFPFTANAQIMAFLQYPKILTPKEIRQINKVFAQRFFE